MSYQNIKTPRFYIDIYNYSKSLNFRNVETFSANFISDSSIGGVSISNPKFFGLKNPSLLNKVELGEGDLNSFNIILKKPTLEGLNWIGIIGKDIKRLKKGEENNDFNISFLGMNQSTDVACTNSDIDSHSVNFAEGNDGFTIISTGDSSFSFDSFIDKYQINITASADNFIDRYLGIGTFCGGTYYDMPLSPDLNVSVDYMYDGYKNVETLSGSTIVQSNYQGSPWWYNIDGGKIEPWSFSNAYEDNYNPENEGISKRNGRRRWTLSFSYMNDKDLFSSNSLLSNYLTTGAEYDGSDISASFTSNLGDAGEFTSNTFQDGTAWTIGTLESAMDTSAGTLRTNSVNPHSDVKDYINGILESKSLTIKVTIKVINVENTEAVINYSNGSTVLQLNSVGIHTATKTYPIGSIFHSIFQNTGGNTNYITLEYFRIEFLNYEADGFFEYNIDTDDSFFSKVLNKIMYGEKFLFQPDNTSKEASDFALCVFDTKSLKIKRSAFNVYDIKFRILEAW